uniref:Uncharacterized protein n=1 Tax=viral metagenome TaxID=1070528 RepID=A0A6M3J6Y1_9ZZZZ
MIWKELLRPDKRKDTIFGEILEVNTSDLRVKVRLQSGLKVWARYSSPLTLEVGDRVLIIGRQAKMVILDAGKYIPKGNAIINV